MEWNVLRQLPARRWPHLGAPAGPRHGDKRVQDIRDMQRRNAQAFRYVNEVHENLAPHMGHGWATEGKRSLYL